MTPHSRLVAARTLSVAALLAALLVPWLGWWGAGGAAALGAAGLTLAPRPASHGGRGRLRAALEALQRRLTRHPWRIRRT